MVRAWSEMARELSDAHGLPYPPGGVGGEAKTARMVIFFDGFHQAQVTFLDQIEKGNSASHVALGDADHQPRIGFDQVLAGALAFFDDDLQLATPEGILAASQFDFFLLSLASLYDADGELQFFLDSQQGHARHLLEIHADRIVAGDIFVQALVRFHNGSGLTLRPLERPGDGFRSEGIVRIDNVYPTTAQGSQQKG